MVTPPPPHITKWDEGEEKRFGLKEKAQHDMQQLVLEGNEVKRRSKEKGEIKLENNML